MPHEYCFFFVKNLRILLLLLLLLYSDESQNEHSCHVMRSDFSSLLLQEEGLILHSNGNSLACRNAREQLLGKNPTIVYVHTYASSSSSYIHMLKRSAKKKLKKRTRWIDGFEATVDHTSQRLPRSALNVHLHCLNKHSIDPFIRLIFNT